VPEASDVVADVLGLSVAIFLFFLWRSTERVVFGAGVEGRRLSWRDLR
jgi:predicted membrane protein